MSYTKFSRQDEERISREWNALRSVAVKRCSGEGEMAVVEKAYGFVYEAYKNMRRRSGEPYILHAIAVARIVVSEMGLGYKSIVSALLHEIISDTSYSVDDIRNLFGEKIASIVEGLDKTKTVLDNEDAGKEDSASYNETLQEENFKRLFLTLNDDARVVLIKLADRLQNCRTIEYTDEYKRDKILSETMFLFIPLAHRLGLYEVKSEMENIWMRYKEAAAYNDINARINQNVSDKNQQFKEFIAPIESALTSAGFNFKILQRVKSPYSIWHKMQTKNVTFDQIYDLYAVRIVFQEDLSSQESERDICYHIFSIITGIYKYEPSRIRDWVKFPKSNGYEALHCTLLSNSGIWIEVQIRSKRMDDIAEKGIAAHWTYKQGGYQSENETEMDKWLVQIKDVLARKDIDAHQLLDIMHSNLANQRIVVFTPKGEQKTIESGATVLDFAYLIHTHIGNQAIAAKVNSKLASLSYVLKPGDKVEIITAQNAQPSLEWLDFLRTGHAVRLVLDNLKSRGIDISGYKKKSDELSSPYMVRLTLKGSDNNGRFEGILNLSADNQITLNQLVDKLKKVEGIRETNTIDLQ